MYSWDLCCLLADGEGRITSFCLVQMKTCFPDGPEVDFSPGPPGNTTEKLMNVFVKPFLSLNHMSLTTKIKLLHRSWMGFEVHLGYRLLKGLKKNPLRTYGSASSPHLPPFPLHSFQFCAGFVFCEYGAQCFCHWGVSACLFT